MKRTTKVILRAAALAMVLVDVSPAAEATPSQTVAVSEMADAEPARLAIKTKKTLKPFDWVDTSSPRSTLKSFLVGTQRYYDLIREDGVAWEFDANTVHHASMRLHRRGHDGIVRIRGCDHARKETAPLKTQPERKCSIMA